jgi:hypothetical protein
MARIAAIVVAAILIAVVSYAIDPTFGLFVIGLIIVCLIAYGGFRLWRVLKN